MIQFPKIGRCTRLAGLTKLTALAVLTLAVFFAGCTARSKVPEPEDPIAYYQLRAQAADHWREIAEDVAIKVQKALLERNDLIDKSIYVIPPPSRPFMAAFHQFLKTEMVSRGMQVSEQREIDTPVLKYDVLAIAFAPSRMGVKRPSGASDHEIVVNARFGYNNRYVRHLSYIRYINDDDWRLYTNTDARGIVMLAGDTTGYDGSLKFWQNYSERETAFTPYYSGPRGYNASARTGESDHATSIPSVYGGRAINPAAPAPPLRR